MAKTAGVLDQNWNVSKISTVSYGWLNTDLHGDTCNCKCDNAAVAEREV